MPERLAAALGYFPGAACYLSEELPACKAAPLQLASADAAMWRAVSVACARGHPRIRDCLVFLRRVEWLG
jgi:hypothetical protein